LRQSIDPVNAGSAGAVTVVVIVPRAVGHAIRVEPRPTAVKYAGRRAGPAVTCTVAQARCFATGRIAGHPVATTGSHGYGSLMRHRPVLCNA